MRAPLLRHQGNAEALRNRDMPKPEPQSWRQAIAMTQPASSALPYGYEFGATPQRPRQLPVTKVDYKAAKPANTGRRRGSSPRAGPDRRRAGATNRAQRTAPGRRPGRVRHGKPVVGRRDVAATGAGSGWALAMTQSLSGSQMGSVGARTVEDVASGEADSGDSADEDASPLGDDYSQLDALAAGDGSAAGVPDGGQEHGHVDLSLSVMRNALTTIADRPSGHGSTAEGGQPQPPPYPPVHRGAPNLQPPLAAAGSDDANAEFDSRAPPPAGARPGRRIQELPVAHDSDGDGTSSDGASAATGADVGGDEEEAEAARLAGRLDMPAVVEVLAVRVCVCVGCVWVQCRVRLLTKTLAGVLWMCGAVVQRLFDRYCRFGDRLNSATGGGMSSAKFYKFVRDCSLIDNHVRGSRRGLIVAGCGSDRCAAPYCCVWHQ